jgi:hypothetical protein
MDEEINNQEELNSLQKKPEKRKWNKTPILIACLIILTALLVILAVPINKTNDKSKEASPETQVEKATLSIEEPKSLGGNLYSAEVMVEGSIYTVSGADLVIKYDPKFVSNLKIANGTFLDSPSILYNTNDPVKGIASYSAVSGIANEGIKGEGVFAVLTFSVIGSPSANISISFAPGTHVAAEGQTQSVLGEAFGVTFIPGTK